MYARANDIADFATKLCELLDDPERRNIMGAIGRRRVEEGLAWHHQIPQLLKAYEMAMGNGSTRAIANSLDSKI